MLHSSLSLGLDDSAAAPAPPHVYDPDALLLFGRMTVQPDEQRKRLIDQVIVALKSVGLWGLFDLLYVFAAHDEQAARLNWKSSSYTCTAVAGPPFVVDRGFTGNPATGGYVAPGWAADPDGVQFQQDSAHLSAWVISPGAPTNARVIGNSVQTSPRALLVPMLTDDSMTVLVNDGSSPLIPNTVRTGFFLANRSGAAAREIYRNGVVLSTDTAASMGRSTSPVTFDRDGSFIYDAPMAQASLGGSLSALLADSYYQIMLAYMREVGAA